MINDRVIFYLSVEGKKKRSKGSLSVHSVKIYTMEGEDGSVTITNKSIKAAQNEMGRLDVLVCGHCHSVFHFIEDFQEHRASVEACSKTSHFRDSRNNEQKAQVWAFLLWKDTQMQMEGQDRDTANSWKLYQKWCKMDSHVRDTWVAAGKTIQTFTKINNANMTDVRPPLQATTTPTLDDSNKQQTPPVRKIIRNGQPEESIEKKEVIKVETKPQVNETTSTISATTPTPVEKKIVSSATTPSITTASTNSTTIITTGGRPKAIVKPRAKPGCALIDGTEPNTEEFVVEKIMAKRYNTKKKCAEYYLKWEGYSSEFNTWESADIISSCKFLLEEFERNLAKQRELKELKQQQAAAALAGQQSNVKLVTKQMLTSRTNSGVTTTITASPTTTIKTEPGVKPGPSSAAQSGQGRPMRSSKSKAMDQVKQWCGSMKEEDNDLLGKRRPDLTDSDSEDPIASKRIKGEQVSEDEWSGESDEERNVRSDVIQRAFHRATNVQSNGSNKMLMTSGNDTSVNMQTSELAKVNQQPILVANAKGVVKVDPKQMPNFASGVYVMHKKEGLIKLDSNPTKVGVKGSPGTATIATASSIITTPTTQGVLMVQNRDVTGNLIRRQVLPATQNSITPVKVVSKPDGTQVVTQMKVIAKPQPVQSKQRTIVSPKSEPVKIQPKPDPNQLQQIHVVTAVPTSISLQPRVAQAIRPTIQQPQTQPQQQQTQQKTPDNRPLLPRPPLRGSTPASVLGISPMRTQVRNATPRTQTPQQRPILQKRLVPAISPQTTITVNQQGQQVRPKTSLISPQQQQQSQSATTLVKTLNTSCVKQSVKTIQSTKPAQQSVLTPQQQQKVLVTKRNLTKEVVGVKTTPVMRPSNIVTTTPVTQKTLAARGRPTKSLGTSITTSLTTSSSTTSTTATSSSSATTTTTATATNTTSATPVKPKETKMVDRGGLHMEFQEIGSEESGEESVGQSKTNQKPSASPPREYTLCPLTGRLLKSDGEPVDQQNESDLSSDQSKAKTSSTDPKSTVAPVITTTTSAVATTGTGTVVATVVTPTPTIITAAAQGTNDGKNTNVSAPGNSAAELVLPSLDSLSEAGGMMRVEMSPGGTTGTIVQSNNSAQINIAGPDLPCLDDTVPTSVTAIVPTPSITETITADPITITTSASLAETITTNSMSSVGIKTEVKEEERRNEETTNLVTITGEDGVVYQVAGQAEDGQTLLVARGADGEQQCVYVTTEQGDGSVLTIDNAVAEAVAQLMPDQVNLTPQFYVKEGEGEAGDNQMVMSIMDSTSATVAGQEDPDSQAQVVAQVVQADDPSPGGTRRVVLLLPDGNLMMTEVDGEQYAALELDK